jgi:hypothetical protein
MLANIKELDKRPDGFASNNRCKRDKKTCNIKEIELHLNFGSVLSFILNPTQELCRDVLGGLFLMHQ